MKSLSQPTTAISLSCLFLFLACATTAVREAKIRTRELTELGRQAIVDLALEEVRAERPSFVPERFERAAVWVSPRAVRVHFEMPIRYLPMESAAYVGYWHILVDAEGATSRPVAVSNPRERLCRPECSFLEPSEESAAAIDFVAEVLELDLEEIRQEGELTVREQPSAYEVSLEWQGHDSLYVVSQEGEVRLEAHFTDIEPPGGPRRPTMRRLADDG